MRKLLNLSLVLALILPSPSASKAITGDLGTVYNPFTGRLDYIVNVTSDTLPSGSTSYIQNISTSSVQQSTFSVLTGAIQDQFYFTFLNSGSVLFIGPGGIVTEDNSGFFYNNANNVLLLRSAVSTQAALDVQNNNDSSSNRVAVFRSGNRATPTDQDEGFFSLFNDDSTGTQVEFSRFVWKANDVTNTSKDSSFEFHIHKGNILRNVFKVNSVEAVFNEDSQNQDVRIETNLNANMFRVDGGVDEVMIGTVTPLGAGLGIIPHATTDFGLAIRGKASQTGDLLNITDDSLNELFVVESDGDVTVTGNMNISDSFGLVVGHTTQIDFGAIPEFQVLGTATSDSSMGFARFENNASGPDVRFLKSRGTTIGSNVIVQDGDKLGRIRFQGADTIDFNTTAAEISGEVDGTPASNNIPGRLIFTTRTDGGSLSEKARLTNAGRFAVGTILPDGILHLDNGTSDTDLIIEKDAGTSADIIFHNAGVSGAHITFDSSENILIENDTSDGDIVFKINDGGVDTELVRLDGSTSRVGFGTPTPSGAVSIENSTDVPLTLDVLTGTQNLLEFKDNGTDVFIMNDEGFIAHGASLISTIFYRLAKSFSTSSGNPTGIQSVITSTVASTGGPIGIASQAITAHTTGNITVAQGYFGGFRSESNSNVTIALGVSGLSEIAASNTPTIFRMIGIQGSVSVRDGTATNAISILGANPTVTTGSITNSWAGNFDGDLQVTTGNRLLLEGSLNAKGDTYFVFDSVGGTVDLFVNGTEAWNASSNTMSIIGGLSVNLVSKTGAYTATSSDHTIICDATSAAFTITLPAVSGVTGIIYNIKKIDSSANAITVDGNGSETIDDATTATISTQYESITIQSDGSEWWIL